MHPSSRPSAARVLAGLLGLLVVLAVSACDATGAASGPCARPTLTGTDEDDRLSGTAGPDVIDGGDGNDRIQGLGGDDVLCGGAGADVLDGGEGDDRLFGQADERLGADTDYYEWYGDTLRGGAGDDLLDVGADDEGGEKRVDFDEVDFRGAESGVRVDLAAGTASGDGEDRIVGDPHGVIGSAAPDVIVGSDRADSLAGWGGADRIVGRGGDDELYAHGALQTTASRPHRARDVLLGGAGDDSVSGGEGDDTLVGGPGKDRLAGDNGADRLHGGAGDDDLEDWFTAAAGQRLAGGPGRDEIGLFFLVRPDGREVATKGSGTVDLGAGRITTTVDGVPVTVAATGLEGVMVPFGSWTIIGTPGPDHLMSFGEDSRVVVRAGGGNDHVSGSPNRDDLDGGPGRDTLIDPPGGGDRITGFEKIL